MSGRYFPVDFQPSAWMVTAKVLVKTNGIGDVPAIEAKALAGFVNLVRRQHLRQASVGGGEGIVMAFAIGAARFKIVGAAEIIFRAGTANGGEFRIAIQEEFDFAFAPPTGGVSFPREISADVLARALHVVPKSCKCPPP